MLFRQIFTRIIQGLYSIDTLLAHHRYYTISSEEFHFTLVAHWGKFHFMIFHNNKIGNFFFCQPQKIGSPELGGGGGGN